MNFNSKYNILFKKDIKFLIRLIRIKDKVIYKTPFSSWFNPVFFVIKDNDDYVRGLRGQIKCTIVSKENYLVK